MDGMTAKQRAKSEFRIRFANEPPQEAVLALIGLAWNMERKKSMEPLREENAR